MSTVLHFQGRGSQQGLEGYSKPWVSFAPPGYAYWVVGHGQPKTNIALCRMVIIDDWGIYLSNPFQRCDGFRHSWMEYLPRDLFIFHAVHIYTVPEEPWMLRGG